MNAKILAVALGIDDDEQAELLLIGIHDATQYQQRYGSKIFDMSIGLKGLNEESHKLQKALEKIANGKGTFDAAYKSVRSGLKSLPEKYLRYLDTFDGRLESLPYDIKQSGFTRTAMLLKDMDSDSRKSTAQWLGLSVAQFINDTIQPGQGNLRRQAKQYLPGLFVLIKHFGEVFPTRRITKSSNSTFYKYAHAWLQQFCKIDNPDRHIEAAVKVYQERLVV